MIKPFEERLSMLETELDKLTPDELAQELESYKLECGDTCTMQLEENVEQLSLSETRVWKGIAQFPEELLDKPCLVKMLSLREKLDYDGEKERQVSYGVLTVHNGSNGSRIGFCDGQFLFDIETIKEILTYTPILDHKEVYNVND